jgi:hypothetical protein
MPNPTTKFYKVLATLTGSKGDFDLRIGSATQGADGIIRMALDVAPPLGARTRLVPV